MPYPEQRELLRDLVVNDHVALEDEPLLLAIYYRSRLVPNEECLLEVARGFGFNEVSEGRRIFQVQFGSTPSFPLPTGDRLRLSLTNAVEFQSAVSEGWPEINDLREAIHQGQYDLLYRRTGDQEADNAAAALGLMAAA